MTEYELAVREIETLKGAFCIAMNLLIIVGLLTQLCKKDKDCYAPVELSGIICIVPEIATGFVLTLPLLGIYAPFTISGNVLIVNGVYLCALWIFRKKIVKTMNYSFL